MYIIRWAPTNNITKGRGGKQVIGIVNHITAGAFNGAVSWLRNPAAGSSAHYVISRQGEIVQLVKDEDTSWHAGIVNRHSWKLHDGTNPNRRTIGIEHEGYGQYGGNGDLTEKQYQATLWLHRELIRKYNIPITRDNIIGHYQIDSVNRPNCPGPKFPWDRLMKDLKSGRVDQRPLPVGPKIHVNGKVLDAIYIGQTEYNTYAPVRAIGEALGYQVAWTSAEGVFVGGVKLDVKTVDGVSYAPVRYLAESLGKTVHFENGVINIY